MTKVLVATEKPFVAVTVEDIREVAEGAGMELALLEEYTEGAQLLDAVKDAGAAIIRSDKVDAEVLDAAKSLRIVVRAGAGYNNVGLDAATAHEVCVMNTPGQSSNTVTELVSGMLVYGVRNFYNGISGTELKRKKLGISVCGNVGRNVTRTVKGFGMEVYAYDASCPTSVIGADDVKAVASTADLFKTCQIVSLHIPATAEAKGSVNFELMNSMPKGATVVNTAHREVMDEADLVKMLEERPDFKYLIDIIPAIHAELTEEYAGCCLSTPKKVGAQTAEANINTGIATAKQIIDFLVNGNEKYRVNKWEYPVIEAGTPRLYIDT